MSNVNHECMMKSGQAFRLAAYWPYQLRMARQATEVKVAALANRIIALRTAEQSAAQVAL